MQCSRCCYIIYRCYVVLGYNVSATTLQGSYLFIIKSPTINADQVRVLTWKLTSIWQEEDENGEQEACSGDEPHPPGPHPLYVRRLDGHPDEDNQIIYHNYITIMCSISGSRKVG